ncbi:pyridoxamine 5'-phosphate oxidase family protein [Chromohalobacter canadensis]|uniref:Pyridoxamine 5'-phosphate oxidase family protein n=1 Tax=Chromohalobacter canadensis TaxID=141389 RepID=A0ABZ0Y7M2_9GAMM|nr:pyridoxamine 5'-phosphate oxidase family protein [Chromohalobacter canadensis]MCK0769746.1 pyridoxamine 5'-phosphate oxidase family protein [Chromohalobacter canadensis]WQH08055.1 pyridoxamine 5'-phosphate oxidase family protein [Chromohalobacter canadensis]
MGDFNLASRSAEILKKCLYANIATSRDDVPWNTPVTALPDSDLKFYWSSWTLAEHSQNIARNSSIFMTFYDSTRARGTNNLMCLYLQCVAREVSDPDEARKAFGILYPGEDVDLENFLGEGVKRFYCAGPRKAWLNCLSEKELEPTTLKMRTEVPISDIRNAFF